MFEYVFRSTLYNLPSLPGIMLFSKGFDGGICFCPHPKHFAGKTLVFGPNKENPSSGSFIYLCSIFKKSELANLKNNYIPFPF
jgi:hypothetical protein